MSNQLTQTALIFLFAAYVGLMAFIFLRRYYIYRDENNVFTSLYKSCTYTVIMIVTSPFILLRNILQIIGNAVEWLVELVDAIIRVIIRVLHDIALAIYKLIDKNYR